MNKLLRNNIKEHVLKALYNSNELCFPVNIKRIVKSYTNCRLISYSKHMAKYGISYEEMLIHAETDDAYTVYEANSDKYLIYYNDIDVKIMSSNRYRWNIAHELGHVLLNHHKKNNKTKIFRNQLSKAEYKILEDEADYFASYILVPHSVLCYAKPESYFDLKEICKISEAASKIRYKNFKQWLFRKKTESYDLEVKKLFLYYCYLKRCNICGYSFSSENALYCPVCGEKNLKWGITEMHYNDGYLLYDNGKTVRCPICDNEDIESNGEYCNICGTHIVNKCSDYYNCGEIASENSRFCIYCGSETTFFKNNLLKPWNEVKLNTENLTKIDSTNIQSDWEFIITQMKNEGRMQLFAFLIDTVVSFKNFVYTIRFKNGDDFKFMVASKTENYAYIKENLEDFYECNINLKLELSEKDKIPIRV